MIKRIYSWLLLLVLSLSIVLPARAQILNDVNDLSSMANTVAATANYNNIEIGDLVAGIIKTILGLLGVIFLALVIVSGFKWMTAGGNQEQVKQATGTMKNAIIGLIIVLMAYAITYFVFTKLPFTGGGSAGRAI